MDTLSGFWVDGFWQSGFWQDDFWLGLTSASTAVSSATSDGTPLPVPGDSGSYWTKEVPVFATWEPEVVGAEAWTAIRAAVSPPPWGMVKPLAPVGPDGGIDFTLTLEDDFPTYITDERAVAIWDRQPERSE